MKKFICTPLLLGIFIFANAQKDCTQDHLGLIPLNDLGLGTYRGWVGGLYPEGSNVRPAEHLTKCVEHVQEIQPLDASGNPHPEGKIVMLGIGASNPGAEFEKFKMISNYYPALNDDLLMVNGCIGSTGIQEMNNTDYEYWNSINATLLANGVSAEQVQICWIEQENTVFGDTAFPSAALSLEEDFIELLRVIRILFPNTQICYISARAYSGYANTDDVTISNGLVYPRDYLNGWTIKWLIENIINGDTGYNTEGPDADIPMVTWGTYHWTDGSTVRSDGLFLDCELDVNPDGLHLSGPGEIKMGQFMFDYFSTDTTASYWFFDDWYTGINENSTIENTIEVFPNPVSGNSMQVSLPEFNLQEPVLISIFNLEGKLLHSSIEAVSPKLSILLPDHLSSGMYLITIESEAGLSQGKFIYSN